MAEHLKSEEDIAACCLTAVLDEGDLAECARARRTPGCGSSVFLMVLRIEK